MSAFISDDNIALRPVERSDLEQLRQWRNDPEIRQRTREWKALTSQDQERWFERITGPHRTDHMFVVTRSTHGLLAGVIEIERVIGVIGLCGWNMHDRHAEISFYMGDKTQRGKGYMKNALAMLIDWGFQQGLHRIWAEVYDFNIPSVKLLEKLGFAAEGRQREHVFREGRFVDSLIMGLLSQDTKRNPSSGFDTAEIGSHQ